jgi:alkaline phosphatase D
VQIILLDARYFRGPLKKRAKSIPSEGPYDPSTDTTSSMLGESQWKWLEVQLKKPATLRILCSSIQVVAQDHHHEKWHNLPHERDRLFKLIRDTGAAGLFCISGDRHLAELSMMDAGIGYPLYDLTSSGLTQGFPKWRKLEVNRHRVMTMGFGNNFGVIAIDWSRPDPLISLQIRDEAGDVTIQERLPLSVLQPGTIKKLTAASVVKINDQILTTELVQELLKKEVTLDMEVRATGASASLIFLNSAPDRTSPENFTVVLDKKAQAKLAQNGVANPRGHYEGKAIRVVGILSTFREAPQIIVSDPKQIQVK